MDTRELDRLIDEADDAHSAAMKAEWHADDIVTALEGARDALDPDRNYQVAPELGDILATIVNAHAQAVARAAAAHKATNSAHAHFVALLDMEAAR